MATVSASDAESLQMERARTIRDKYGRFRILVIGRANAGKTTILKVVCNTTEDPEIFNSSGEKIESSVLTPSEARVKHDIENEMIFRSNPGFIFHDSRGFEAGGTDELMKVEAFIAERSGRKRLGDRVHAIWYCIPVDDSRPFTEADARFFSDCSTGSVPMIVIFTKFDALETKAYGTLRKEKVPIEDRGQQVALRAVRDFAPVLERLNTSRYCAKSHICLGNMHRPNARCDELMECTASALDDNILKHLFVSTQQNNLKLCVEDALERYTLDKIMKCGPGQNLDHIFLKVGLDGIAKDDMWQMHWNIMRWFPHVRFNNDHDDFDFIPDLRQCLPRHLLRLRHDLCRHNLHYLFPDLDDPDISDHIGDPPAIKQMARLGVATTIIAEHSFFLWEHHQIDCHKVACEAYIASHQCRAVKEAVDKAFRHNKEQFFLPNKDCLQVQKAFALQLTQIALDNRLPKNPLN